MKVKLTATLILIIPMFGFSQISQSIDIVSGIEYSYRNLTTSSEDEIVTKILESRDNEESGKFNWRIGFNYNQRLRLASVGYKGEKITGLRWGSEYDGMGGWVPDPNLSHEIQSIYDYWFAEIPIVGRFELNEKKLAPFFELGISPSIYLTTRTKSATDIGTDAEFQNDAIHDFNKVHIVGFISFGLNYSINEKYQFFGQPILRYHFTKLADRPIAEYLFNYGIEIGIRRKIK